MQAQGRRLRRHSLRLVLGVLVGVLASAGGCVPRPRYRVDPIQPVLAPRNASPQVAPSPPKKSPQDTPKWVPTDNAYQIGLSSYYAHYFHGKPTASGEIFDMNGLSAAHRQLPLGTVIRVTHLENGLSIVVKVNDRGPFVDNRILDLSLGAARELDMVQEGVAKVRIDIVEAIE